MAEDEEVPPAVQAFSDLLLAECLDVAAMMRDTSLMIGGFPRELTVDETAVWLVGATNGFAACVTVLRRHNMLTPPRAG